MKHLQRSRTSAAAGRQGLALLVVLLALMALLALAAPFLWMTGQAEATAVRGVDRRLANLALEDAARAARTELWALHDELDPTPRYDELEELRLGESRDPRFWTQPAEDGTRFDAQAIDLAGRADLWSASPHLMGNLLGRASYLSRPLAPDGEELRVGDAAQFPPRAWLLVGGEVIGYRARAGSLFSGLERGVGAGEDDCGFLKPSTHPIGTPVVALEAAAFSLWRAGQRVEPRVGARWGDVAADLGELMPEPLVMDEEGRPLDPLPAEDLVRAFEDAFERTASFQAGYSGGRQWQRSARVLELPTPCELVVSEWRWGNPGSTVRVSSSAGVEYGLILRIDPGRIRLLDALKFDHPALETELSVLARRPVNINTAPLELVQALFQGVTQTNQPERVSAGEASDLADLVLELRPFDSLQDFAERLLLPAADILVGSVDEDPEETRRRALDLPGGGVLEREDVVALYANALNANDSSLAFSTAPLSFEARDLYELDVRASVERGAAERARVARGSIEHILPQIPLVEVWDSQVDFDEALRLDREAPGWASGPRATSVFDSGRFSSPPARRFAHLAIDGGDNGRDAVARPTYAAKDQNGFSRPWVARTDEVGQRAGRVRHFDRSNSNFEGYGIDLAGPYSLATGRGGVGWTRNEDQLLRPFSLSFWMNLEGVGDGVLFELGDNADTERLTLRVEEAALRLELLDATGDHPDTNFEERLELSLPLGSGPAAGLLDGWAHIELDISGASPDRVDWRIDGMALTDPELASRIERGGMTALTENLSGSDTTIQVESTAGFPPRCVLRIGDELIEAVVSDEQSFDATHSFLGELAGFGGRFARERTSYANLDDFGIPDNLGVADPNKGSYPEGTAVRLHGYSLATIDNVPPGATTLASSIGPFAAGYVASINGGDTGDEVLAEVEVVDGTVVEIVFGSGIADDAPNTLELMPLDAGQTSEDVLSAFSDTGGFAVILQSYLTGPGSTNAGIQTQGNTPLWGMHVFRYSGKEGGGLRVAQWAVGSGDLPLLTDEDTFGGVLTEAKAFVLEYEDNWRVVDGSGQEILTPDQANDDLKYLPIVVPISIPAAGNADSLLPVAAQVSTQVAQIVEPVNAELTEWVRYDHFDDGQLVRHDPAVLLRVFAYATLDPEDLDFREPGPISNPEGGDDGPTGGTPGGSGPGAAGGAGTSSLGPGTVPSNALGFALAPAGPPAPRVADAAWPAAPARLVSSVPQQAQFWTSEIGAAPDQDWPATRSLRSALDFRGAMGTHAQSHGEGTPVTPVFRVFETGSGSPQAGWPGRFDAVFAVDPSPLDPGFPGVVHRAYRPVDRQMSTWASGEGRVSAPGIVETVPEAPGSVNTYMVGLTEALGVPLAAGTSANFDGGDARHYARFTKFPSGELPRLANTLVFGESLGTSPAAATVIDELVFGASEFGEGYRTLVGDEGAGLVLQLRLDASESNVLTVRPRTMRLAAGDVGLPGVGDFVLDDLPEDAGLLQIGEELILYSGVEPESGELRISPGGRGVLGSRVQHHAPGETVRFLHAAEATRLGSGIDEGSDSLPLVDAEGFPGEGTVLIGEELIHHTWQRAGQLGMPRRSTEPGARDHKGPGLFRGRFGTTPSGHSADEVVLRFPVRYWDRFEPQSDGPELHYLGFSLGVPDAFVEGFAFEASSPPGGTTRLGVLQRHRPDVPWDGDPDRTPGLDLVYSAPPDQGLYPLGEQTRLAEWRVFNEFMAGSFDARGGLQHGWKQVPDLRQFVAGYFGAGRVLSTWMR